MKDRKEKAHRAETAVSHPTKKAYQKPAICYEGFVTTRAGSPLGVGDEPFDMLGYILQQHEQ